MHTVVACQRLSQKCIKPSSFMNMIPKRIRFKVLKTISIFIHFYHENVQRNTFKLFAVLSQWFSFCLYTLMLSANEGETPFKLL